MYGKMQESGLIEIIPLICTSVNWGRYSTFSHPEFPQGSQARIEGLQSLMAVTCLFTDMAGNIPFLTITALYKSYKTIPPFVPSLIYYSMSTTGQTLGQKLGIQGE